jgi:transcriptional regulator with XRE-family HTH domain
VQQPERTLGGRIRAAREAKGWTPTRLAARLGLALETLSKYEGDQRQPRRARLRQLGEELGVDFLHEVDAEGDGAETVGERIRRLRKTAGLTQEQLANALGVTKGAISHYEHDMRVPGGRDLALVSSRLLKLAGALGVTTDELLGAPAVGGSSP